MTDGNRRWQHVRSGVLLAVALSLIALIVASVGTVAGLSAIARSERTANAGLTDLRDSEMATCIRVQRLRNQSNAEARVIYLTLSTVTQSAKARGSDFARFYRELTKLVTFTPPTDCDRAVFDPRDYRPPPPIRFVDCATPPPADFSGCLRRRP